MKNIKWLYYMPEHDKPTKWPVQPGNTRISLGIHPGWSQSSRSHCRRFGSLATHKSHHEDWSNWSSAQAVLSHHWFCPAPAEICFALKNTYTPTWQFWYNKLHCIKYQWFSQKLLWIQVFLQVHYTQLIRAPKWAISWDYGTFRLVKCACATIQWGLMSNSWSDP